MSPARLSIIAAAVAVVTLLVVGLTQLPGSTSAGPTASGPTLGVAQMQARLAGSPAPLAALHAQADELLSGGLGGLRARLAALRGEPIVVNKWASWCQPCRAEFGVFQRVSVARGRAVAFLGIDSGDAGRADPSRFLREHPVSYPSYYDPSGNAGTAIADSSFTPVTVFYDRRGRQYIRQGPYLSAAKLEQDVARYALDG